MRIVYDDDELVAYMAGAVAASPEHPVLIDKFLEDAIEVDVDAVSDGEDVYVAAIMQHVEEAGVHSGDSSACCRRSRSARARSTRCAGRRRLWPAPSACAG